jgi:hypothetical protein
LTYLLHYNHLVFENLYRGRIYSLHICESARHFEPFVSTYIHCKQHHIKIPIFIAAKITNLTFLIISYRSSDYKDELVWAAAWLFWATNDTTYLNTAESLYNEFGLQNLNGAFNWDNKVSGVQVRYMKEFKFTVSMKNQ